MDWYIGNEWRLERKGLRKCTIDLQFQELEKPHLTSKVLIKIWSVADLDRTSDYLAGSKLGEEQQIEMGSALTPVDHYVELLVRQMIVGERACCYIRTGSTHEITFELSLLTILETKETHKLSAREMYELALRYKENGVRVFKQYPRLAHDYFALAAKCLISYKPFEKLTLSDCGVAGSDMAQLFVQIQTNLAACLLIQKRYEDVIYLTSFVETAAEPSEKSIYRRATAYFHLQEFEAAQRVIEKVPNYKKKLEFAQLHQRVADSWRASNNDYKIMMQRIFSAKN